MHEIFLMALSLLQSGLSFFNQVDAVSGMLASAVADDGKRGSSCWQHDFIKRPVAMDGDSNSG